jgi:DNA-binding NarL/FixJ family response regulator
MIRVLLADDQSLVRMGFSMVLSAQDDIEVVGEASDGAVALEMIGALEPDVVLMDVRMPNMNGIEATRQAIEKYSNVRIIVLTTFDMDEYAFAALRAGASGFLLKDVRPEALISAIRSVAAGEAAISPRITRAMLEMFAAELPKGSGVGHDDAQSGTTDVSRPERGAVGDPRLETLTPREKEVLAIIAEGLSNSEIAERLFVSEATVKTHVGNILSKLCLRDRVQAVILAFEAGLVTPGSSDPGEHPR